MNSWIFNAAIDSGQLNTNEADALMDILDDG